jgi:hypothetical protein
VKQVAALASPFFGAFLLVQSPAGLPADSPMEQRIAGIVTDFRGVMGVAAIDLTSGATIAVNGATRFPTIRSRRAAWHWTRGSRSATRTRSADPASSTGCRPA